MTRPTHFKPLTAGVLAGLLLWTFSSLAAGSGARAGDGAGPAHGTAARARAVAGAQVVPVTPAGSAPVPGMAARQAQWRGRVRAEEAAEADRIARRHKFAIGRKIWTARYEERQRQARLARQRREAEERRQARERRLAEARRKQEAQRREQARQEAVRRARARADRPDARAAKARVASSRPAVAATLDDVQLLARLVEIEAGGEPYAGKVAVAAVILNRVRSSQFPDSIRAVIFAPGQFPTVAERIARVRPGAAELQAAREALAGRDPSNGALYFYNPALHRCDGPESRQDFLCSLKVTARIGHHVFAR